MDLGINTPLSASQLQLFPQTMPKTAASQLAESLAQPTFNDALLKSASGVQKAETSSPASMVTQFINEVNSKEQEAAATRTAFLAGEPVSLHQTMIASQEASISFSLMVEMRNKVMEAYQELMRIQI